MEISLKKLAMIVVLVLLLGAGWYFKPVYAEMADEELDANGHRSLLHSKSEHWLTFWVSKSYLSYFSLNHIYRISTSDTEVWLSLQTIAAGTLRPDEYKLSFRVVHYSGDDSLPMDWYWFKRVNSDQVPATVTASKSGS